MRGAVKDDLPERRPRPGLHRFRVLATHMPAASPGARWLDLGGGAGEFSRSAADRGYAVTLVDGDPRNVARAADQGLRSLQADLNAPLSALPDASFRRRVAHRGGRAHPLGRVAHE